MAAGERVDTATLCRLLGSWTRPGAPLPNLLADAIAELIASGALPDGAVMPSQRALATALGVARGTVTEAYQSLEARDQLQARAGSGSRVRRRGADLAQRLDARLSSFTGHETPLLDLSSGALPGLPMVSRALTGIDPTVIAAEVGTDGYHPAGLPALRAAVADRYTEDGLPTTDNQILVTSGSQQAVWLVAHTFVGPGDEVVVEEPSYRGALEAFRAAGARPISVPVGEDGLDVAHLARTLGKRTPRLLYCQPNVHNPTGTSMSSAARRALAALIGRAGLLTVEDTCNVDLLVDGREPRPPLAQDGPPDRVLSIGTASKLFWGGLRVGWIRGDPTTIFRLTEAKKAADLGCAVVDQIAVTELLGHADLARAERAAQLRATLDAAERIVAERRPHWRWTTPHGGTGLWVDTGEDAVALAERARRRSVRLSAGPAFSAFGAFREHIRLPTWHPADDLAEGFDRLDT